MPANEVLHPDGWLEVRVPMEDNDIRGRMLEKLEQFQNFKNQNELSNLRLKYLYETVQMLKVHGQVFLVRIPSHPEIMSLEEELIPNFNFLMSNLAENEEIAYLDLCPMADDFDYTDGLHLHQSSSYKISRVVGNWIKSELAIK